MTINLTQIRSDFDNGIIVSKQTLLALVDYAIELQNGDKLNKEDLLPPMEIRNDRDMLNYLHQAFENEICVCNRCGHEEKTSIFDSAHFLREYMAKAPNAL